MRNSWSKDYIDTSVSGLRGGNSGMSLSITPYPALYKFEPLIGQYVVQRGGYILFKFQPLTNNAFGKTNYESLPN